MTDPGFRVTVEDLTTGDVQAMIVKPGDYMLIPFAPCFLAHTQKSPGTGSVVLTLKDHKPQGPAEVDSDTAAAVKYYGDQSARRKARIDEALALIEEFFSKPSGEVALYRTATAIRSALKGTPNA